MFPSGLPTISAVRDLLARHGLSPRKKWGQHFLTDGGVLGKILATAAPDSGDCVLEIGPGLGALTHALVSKAGKVLAVELDKGLAGVLAVELHSAVAAGVLEITTGDILKLDIAALVKPYRDMRLKVAANLPYYITTPVIMRLLEAHIPFESITVMIQKEVAERMSVRPGSKAYGSLTLAVQYYATVEWVTTVPVGAFHPRPEVESAVICLRMRPQPPVTAEAGRLFGVIRAAFATRRKTLVNALHAAGYAAGSPGSTPANGGKEATPGNNGKEALAAALVRCGLRPDIRGEALDIHQFAALAEMLIKTGDTGEI